MDWMRFLTDNHIDFVTRGPNTRKGEVSVKCPLCGDEDPSEHMGIVLEGEAWGCHRNRMHRGKNPVKLVSNLLHCSYEQARLVVSQYNAPDPETLDEALAALQAGPAEAPAGPEAPLRLLPEFKQPQRTGLMRHFYKYLYNRGFHNPERLSTRYSLKGCFTGRWRYRLIVPVYRNRQLVAWTGRLTVPSEAAPRYLSTSDVIKKVVFNEDALKQGGDTLVVVEGPMDALKMDYYGHEFGLQATCVFGTSITIDQFVLLKRLSRKFRKTVLLFDPEAIETAFDAGEWLKEAVIGTVPEGAEDPGAMSPEQVKTFARQYC